jgi:hypothetical protein
MYHTKFKEQLYTSNTCIFYYLHSYIWHTNESITSSHRSANKSPNTQCKVPTNQESNSLAPRNRIQKLKITVLLIYRWFVDENCLPSSPPTRRHAPADLSSESADSGPNVAGFHPPPSISCFSNRLRLRFQPDEMGNAVTSVLPTRGDKIVYMWVVGQVRTFLYFWFNLNFIQQNGRDLKKFLHQCS